MREHKFQAWCRGKLHKSFTLRSISEYELEPGEGMKCSWPEDTIFREYTGLKDKNGKEIYEGDILRGDQCNRFPLEIVWNPENVQFCGNWHDNHTFAFEEFKSWIFRENMLTNFEIIGNIYENPELGDK